MSPSSTPRLLSISRTARTLGIAGAAVHALVRSGDLHTVRVPGYRYPKVTAASVDQFLARPVAKAAPVGGMAELHELWRRDEAERAGA